MVMVGVDVNFRVFDGHVVCYEGVVLAFFCEQQLHSGALCSAWSVFFNLAVDPKILFF